MSDIYRARLKWLKSTASGTQNCVEIARRDEFILIRDSQDPDESILAITARNWVTFLSQIRARGQ